MSLRLFPARAAIGTAIDSTGRSYNVYSTPEFNRALSALLVRVGGETAFSIDDIELLMSFVTPQNAEADKTIRDLQVDRVVGHIAEIAELDKSVMDVRNSAPDYWALYSSLLQSYRNAVEELKFEISMLSDCTAALGELRKTFNTKAVQVLAQTGVAVSHTGDLLETTLATITVPAGLMGPNSVLRIIPLFSYTNSANTKTLRVDFGGTDFYSVPATTTTVSQQLIMIRNQGATNAQVGHASSVVAGVGATATAKTTAAVDTSTDQTITITGQLANAGETITLEGYTVEHLPG